MEHGEHGPAMNQQIFNMGLSVETISLYLLLCGLKDAGVTLSTKNILERWNGSYDSFKACMEELEQKNIVSPVISDGENNEIFRLKDVHGWQ